MAPGSRWVEAPWTMPHLFTVHQPGGTGMLKAGSGGRTKQGVYYCVLHTC